jgi:hypothetical protein
MHVAELLGAAPPVTVLEQHILGARPRFAERRFQALRDSGAQLAVAPGMRRGERFQVGDDGRTIDQFDGARGTLGVEHHARVLAVTRVLVVTEPGWSDAKVRQADARPTAAPHCASLNAG